MCLKVSIVIVTFMLNSSLSVQVTFALTYSHKGARKPKFFVYFLQASQFVVIVEHLHLINHYTIYFRLIVIQSGELTHALYFPEYVVEGFYCL